jgi:LEA14-like dessication related protein
MACLAMIQCAMTTSLVGCSSYRDPQIAMKGATLTERTAEAIAANVVFDLANPNDEALELVEVEYSVRVNGEKLTTLRRAAQATLAGKGVRQIQIPIVLPFEELNWTPENVPDRAEFAVRGTVQYVTPGEIAQILFDTGVRKPRVGFEAHGTLAIRE